MDELFKNSLIALNFQQTRDNSISLKPYDGCSACRRRLVLAPVGAYQWSFQARSICLPREQLG